MLFFTVLAVSPTFGLNLTTSRFFDFFSCQIFLQKQRSFIPCRNFIQKLMQKCYIKGTHSCFTTSCSTVVIHIYSAFKIEKIVNYINFVIFTFL